MPELPEMERYRSVLNEYVNGKVITGVEINREKALNIPAEAFHSQVLGSRITGISRRAKHIIFHLNSGIHLLLHLMLGGWLYIGNDGDNPNRTKQVILSFGVTKLYFIGLRLGYLHLVLTEELNARFAELGPEPLDPAFQWQEWQERLHGKRGTLKAMLVDQKFISGIGNCYSDEICFAAGLRTDRKADELSDEQSRALFASIQAVLTRAFKLGGYMDNSIFAGDTMTGGYNDQCLVYDRDGEPCRRCGASIIRLEVSSRKSFVCPNCQA